MKILFIAEFYAPDSAIGAVRISKLSKYLSEFGHDVTVLCSAKCVAKKDDRLLEELDKVSIHRFNNSATEERTNNKPKEKKTSHNSHYAIKKTIRQIYKNIIYPIKYLKETNETKNAIIKYFDSYLKNVNYDVIFATFSPRASVEAGMIIAEKYNVPLIVDFRDLMDGPSYPWLIQKGNGRIQESAIKQSACTYVISNGQRNIVHDKYRKLASKVEVLNNGFDDEDSIKAKNSENVDIQHNCNTNTEELVFVYTGLIYSGKRDLTPIYKVIKELKNTADYRFRFIYAGTESQLVRMQMEEYKISDILDDRGLISRTESELVQSEADIFLVASWNTKKEQGIMTGKFYDGIRSGKTIVTLIDGDEPNSDLYLLNEEYHYGYCYEAYRDNCFEELRDYIRMCYEQKRKNGRLDKHKSDKLRDRFSYKSIAKQLESKIQDVTSKGI